MKRWQTRGEVQDSDEEELSLEKEQDNLNHPSKRLKVDEEDHRGDQDGNAAKVAQTAIAPIQRLESGVAEGPSAASTKEASNTTQYSRPATAHEDDDEPGWTSRSTTKTYGRLKKISRPNTSTSKELVPVITQAEQNAVDIADVQLYDVPSSDNLPEDPIESQNVPVQLDISARSPTPQGDIPSPGDPTSRASSPLSELSNPPDSPPAFLNPSGAGDVLPREPSDVLSASSRNGQTVDIDDYELPPALLTQGARRSLRARQEKQLHPYMYDKAQYLRQCRERGLRPIRLMEQAANETQGASLDQDHTQPSSSATRPGSSASDLGESNASGINPEHSFETNSDGGRSPFPEEELPDIDTLLQNRAKAGKLSSRKRQKLSHKPLRHIDHSHVEDEFSVPPSPPPSSRESGPTTAKAPKGFRLPRGLSPMPLPTPQISSDIRPFHGDGVTTLSDEDAPPRTIRRLARVRSAVTVASDSPSEAESSSEDDQMLLNRERRRIRGVLPASWLNIDRAKPAQNPNPELPGPESPSLQAAPQRGVARKLQRPSTRALSHNVMEISDEDGASESDNTTPTAMHNRPALHGVQSTSTLFQDDEAMSDEMEVDWFDPMLAGSSRPRQSPKSKSKRQPRITDVMKRKPALDFSEERNGLRQLYGSMPRKQRSTGKKANAKSATTKRQPKPPQLGILDAPKTPRAPGTKEPQFARLAARQARQRPDRGRQSPSHKVIRLATREDTDQANAVLHDWTQGKITQQNHAEPRGERPTAMQSRQAAQQHPRTPLTNMSNRSSRLNAHSVPHEPASKSAGQGVTAPETSAAHSTDHEGQRPGTTTRNKRQRHTLPNKFALVNPRYRDAQLETQESAYMQQNRPAALRHRMQCMIETVARKSASQASGALQMSRYLQEVDEGVDQVFHTGRATSPVFSEMSRDQVRLYDATPAPAQKPRRPRKRRAQPVDAETSRYRQPSEPLPVITSGHDVHDVGVGGSPMVLRGLGPSGTRYATDFDIRRLPQSTYFHESTFIGSGDLAAALALADRDMDRGAGSLRIFINDAMHEWTAWSEEVSTAMAEIPSAIAAAIKAVDSPSSPDCAHQIAAVTSNIDHMLRSVVRYMSSCLHFLDAVDRKTCCERLDQVIEDVLDVPNDSGEWPAQLQSTSDLTAMYALILARQNQIVGNNASVPLQLRAKLRDRVEQTASKLANRFLPAQLSKLRSIYEEQEVVSLRDHGVRRDDSILAGMVILHHCLRVQQGSESMFWKVIGRALGADPTTLTSSADIDGLWYSIFTILPSLDISSAGIMQTRKDEVCEMDWTLPRQLIERCLALYPATSVVRGSSVNEYVRANLRRCFQLFSFWRWWKCESVLKAVYDFFTRRNLSLLHCEEGRGSPAFLDNLTGPGDLSLDAEPADRSFAIYLKLLAKALRTWRKHGVYPDKKITGVAWRLIPNHARLYKKDAEVRQADLDALRNHFDLLCTLYFTSPPSHRLGVDMLRNLVDHSTSHREACRISVRAWSRLASFQMSTDESLEKLEPFVEWFKDMTRTTVSQYRFARTEADQQYSAAEARGTLGLSREVLEATVSSNQRQIAATLVDLLAAFRRALTSAHDLESARFLIESCKPWKAFDSFGPSERRLLTVYDEALEVMRAAIEVQLRFQPPPVVQAMSEDSQDYGDVDVLQQWAAGEMGSQHSDANACVASQEVQSTVPAPSQQAERIDLVVLVHDAFTPLLSNAFGSDISPDDNFLERLVDVWTQLAKHLIGQGLRSWSSFIDKYSAWSQLRDTVQRRKFTPYLLAKILEADPAAFESLHETVLDAWLRSLVEREATLKYQHLLTSTLPNAAPNEPLLQNLPLSKALATSNYQISLQELRQRRLGLIANILSNMLQHSDRVLLDSPRDHPEVKRVYVDMLQSMMQAMRSNYKDLQPVNSTITTDSSIHGAYTIFVQEVVTLLQQYISDRFCKVDNFFLNPSMFPLPVNDPTYIVGKLKKHVPRLSETKTKKLLATFVHETSERAAVDNQQAYLADQFHRAMSGTLELGDEEAPSLRHVVLTSIFPAYFETVFGTSCTWILALPMLEASARIVSDLLYDTDLSDERSVGAAMEQVRTLLAGVQKSFARLLTQNDVLEQPRVLKIATAMLAICISAVTFINHVQRSTGKADSAMEQLEGLQRQATRLSERLAAPEDFWDYAADDCHRYDPQPTWQDVYAFQVGNIQDSMTRKWRTGDERCFVRVGNGEREVVVQVGGLEEERNGLLEAIAAFCGSCAKQRTRGRRAKRGLNAGSFGLEMLVI